MSTSVSITPEELERCAELLEAFAGDCTILTRMDPEVRVRLLVAAGRISRPTRDEQRQAAKAARRLKRAMRREHDREVTATTEIRAARRAEVYVAPPQLVAAVGTKPEDETRELIEPRYCYVCKQPYQRLHFFYDAMCGPCAELNYAKRFQTTSLEGRTALITGARIKIGFHAALMMLRAGARVLVTTRFPRDAAQRFAKEADFETWKNRLQVYGLDLRHAPSVEIFARYITQTESRLDILINNAAQTVRRPAGFYAHLLDLEQRPFGDLPAPVRSVLGAHEECKSAMAVPQLDAGPANAGFVAWRGGDGPGIGIRNSALLSQIPCAYDDASRDHELFPAGRADADLQQIDLRTTNSWRLTLADVPSPEMLEVQLVNAVAPFILCSKLKPLMVRDQTDEKHIVNVSAMEGQFSRRTKTDKHPHTNMAKAALNMMTLTSAPDYAASGIFMNAVDTGWVTDEDPAQHATRKREVLDFQPPLDIVDGAARICDPFFSGLISGNHVWGKFLKDYTSVAW
jgi:NAD(P)-dependent dehydrogenase (short-subunit alcohol dehydrogenase family)